VGEDRGALSQFPDYDRKRPPERSWRGVIYLLGGGADDRNRTRNLLFTKRRLGLRSRAATCATVQLLSGRRLSVRAGVQPQVARRSRR